MKIKVIDLLNKISKGEEVPKKIQYCGVDYYWTGTDYENSEADEVYFWSCIYNEEHINDDIEIEDKKIEKLSILTYSDLIDMTLEELVEVIKEQRFKINEIIDIINRVIKCINY